MIRSLSFSLRPQNSVGFVQRLAIHNQLGVLGGGASGSGAGFLGNLTSGQLAFGTTAIIAGGVSSMGATLHDKDKPGDTSPSQP